MSKEYRLSGARYVIRHDDELYPQSLRRAPRAPERLYVVGNPEALQPGLAVIGARKATPYGRGCAHRFAKLAAEKGICIISGGARGCDAESHRAALEARGLTVAFLGGGCDKLYPKGNASLFQQIIDAGGAIVSEHHWDREPRPYMFRERNRLIAGLADAVLIVEAGLPSGTFSTADEALEMGKEVLVVPGAITSESSHGSNRLLYQGAIPIVDDESFEDALFTVLGMLKRQTAGKTPAIATDDPILSAVLACPASYEELYELARAQFGAHAREKLVEVIAEAEMDGIIARQPDGKWGPSAQLVASQR